MYMTYRITILLSLVLFVGAGCNTAEERTTKKQQDLRTASTEMLSEETKASVSVSETPVIEIKDQSIEQETFAVSHVFSPEDAWLVLYADDGGKPGTIVHTIPLESGELFDIEIDMPIDTPGTYFAVLHVDMGVQETFEFPGPDVAMDVGGKVVVEVFEVE